jgi:hypothetical protein
MKQSVFIKYLFPFFQWYTLMIFIAIVIDYFLHRFQMVAVGRYLGYVGTFVVIISFVYSLRKRKIIQTGSPKKLLELHEYLAWIGSILIIVHAGIHFNALLPWLAILMLLITVATGLIGKFLLLVASESLKVKKQELLSRGINKEDTEKELFFDSVTVGLMKKWRAVHLPITFVLLVLVILHIITIVMYSK